MKLGLIFPISAIVFFSAATTAIARADNTPAPENTVATFHPSVSAARAAETRVRVGGNTVRTASVGHVQRCAVVHGDLVCSAPVALQGRPDHVAK